MNPDSDTEISALRGQLFILKIALIVVSSTVTAYFFTQARIIGKDLEANQKLVNSFNQGQPIVAEFANQLGVYGMTHAEIRPVLAKYGIVPAATQPTLSAPKTAAPKK